MPKVSYSGRTDGGPGVCRVKLERCQELFGSLSGPNNVLVYKELNYLAIGSS